MNLNDLRANAYGAQKNNYKKTENTEKKENIKPFVPPRITKLVSKESEEQSDKSDKIINNEKKQEKPLFKDVNNEIGKILAKDTTDYLKSEGLVKVPVSESGKDGKDSVYRRVAKFLLLIGIDEAAKILPHLTSEQTEKIIPEIATIRGVPPEEASEILSEFNGLLEKSRESGGVETALNILEKAYGKEKAQEILEKSSPLRGAKPFDYLNDADSERIYLLLSDEVEQVQALVLSRLDAKKAATVINLMLPQKKVQVARRLVKMTSVSPDVLKRVDKALREKSLLQTSSDVQKIDGQSVLASILKKMNPMHEQEILSKLSKEDPTLSENLRKKLFTIEDIINADNKFIQEELRKMSDSEIAMLVFSKPKDFVKKIYDCISEGRKKLVQDEIEVNAPYRSSDCEVISSRFFGILRRAFENGELIIKGRNEEEYV